MTMINLDRASYFKHLSLLFSGTAVAQIFNFVSYPFLTRIYTPEDFGIFTIFLTIVLMTSVVSCARFDAVITVSKKYERLTVYKLAIVVNLFLSIIIGIIAYFLSDYFDATLSLLLSLSVLILGFCSSSSFFLLKMDGYSLNSASLIFKSAFTAIPQILLAFAFEGFYGLILGFCIGCFFQAMLLYFFFIKNIKKLFTLNMRKSMFIFFKYKSFIQYDIPSVILSATSFSIINFMIADLYSNKEVGFYGIAYRIAAVPLAVFSSSLSQVFFQKASSAMEANGNYWQEFKYNLLISIVICCLVVLFILFFLRPIVEIYLGQDWLLSANIIIYLAPLLATRFISVSLASAFLVLKRPKVLLINNAFLVLVGVIVYFFSKNSLIDFIDFIYIYSLSMSFIYIVFIIFVFSESKKVYVNS